MQENYHHRHRHRLKNSRKDWEMSDCMDALNNFLVDDQRRGEFYEKMDRAKTTKMWTTLNS